MHGKLAYLHVTAALVALIAGLFVVYWRKGKALHRLIGIAYVFAMLLTNISALMLYNLTGRFNLFHAFALLSLALTLPGLLMPIVRPRNWIFHHVHLMGWSYLGLLAAAANEAAIRLPLHLDTAPRILAAGAIIAVGTGLAGFILRPQWERAALGLMPAGRR